MTFNVYAIKDEINDRFMQPNFIRSEVEATRLFKYQLNENPIWKSNAGDFGLYCLGQFDEEKGFIDNKVTKIIGGNAVKENE